MVLFPFVFLPVLNSRILRKPGTNLKDYEIFGIYSPLELCFFIESYITNWSLIFFSKNIISDTRLKFREYRFFIKKMYALGGTVNLNTRPNNIY
jgi:hypothetical protein